MIDIHSHIIPNVDDGSKSIQMTLSIIKSYVEQGVSVVICTPHQSKDVQRTEKLVREYNALKEAVKDYPVKLLLGAEIYYYPEMSEDLKSGKLLTLNGTNKVLVEFSTLTPTDVADVVYGLKIAGYTPIVAHIERYSYLNKQDYFSIKDNGGLIQINAGSIKHSSLRKTAKYLLKNNLVDFIASDCHNDTTRKVDFDEIKKLVSKKYHESFNKLFINQIEI